MLHFDVQVDRFFDKLHVLLRAKGAAVEVELSDLLRYNPAEVGPWAKPADSAPRRPRVHIPNLHNL